MTPVERVMAALVSESEKATSLRDCARAAIEALREPSEKMMDAPTWYDGDASFTPGDAKEVWEQMLDAALAEGE